MLLLSLGNQIAVCTLSCWWWRGMVDRALNVASVLSFLLWSSMRDCAVELNQVDLNLGLVPPWNWNVGRLNSALSKQQMWVFVITFCPWETSLFQKWTMTLLLKWILVAERGNSFLLGACDLWGADVHLRQITRVRLLQTVQRFSRAFKSQRCFWKLSVEWSFLIPKTWWFAWACLSVSLFLWLTELDSFCNYSQPFVFKSEFQKGAAK